MVRDADEDAGVERHEHIPGRPHRAELPGHVVDRARSDGRRTPEERHGSSEEEGGKHA